MVRLPDGKITLDGKTTEVKSLSMSETEVPWDVFEIWALRLDQSTADQVSGKKFTVSRPSRPYAVIFTGFGHHGFPANCVSIDSAKEFCKWLSEKTGKKYRLPTVAEWQYAAKADGATSKLDDIGWNFDNADDVTHKVGTKKPNSFGLYDTLGNVAEWAINHKSEAVICGGSWKDEPKDISITKTTPTNPKWNESDPQNPKSKWWLANGQFIGLRVVCE